MKGVEIRDTVMNGVSVRVHYTADPFKDPQDADPKIAAHAQEWLSKQRALYPDPNVWEQEMEINFFVGSGARVFPQFRKDLHCSECKINHHRVVYRAWDFGWHSPVCLFAQIDKKERLLILKEIVGSQESTDQFAQRVIRRSTEWFPNHAAGFEDFCDPAGQQVKSVESEKSERRDTEILAGLGINARYQWGWSRKDGRSLTHQLLNLRSDGAPSLYVDDSGAPLLAQAFLGRYVYKTRQDGTVEEEPDDRTHPWSDLMAALRYMTIGLHPKLGVARFQMGRAQPFVDSTDGMHGYGSPRRH